MLANLTPDQIVFLAWLAPVFLGASSIMLVRDLPAVRRYLGEVA
ncbi:hypothetical protein [Methylobacterium sp. E-065]|nr:hypothetical protein [Methylobacterium sp. E-065]